MSTSAARGGLDGLTRPGKLNVRSVSATVINVSWAPSHGNVRVAGYRIYVNGALRASVRSSSFQVRGLRCSTKYALAVSAYDSAGRASRSRSRYVRTLHCASGRKAPQCTKTWSGGLAGAIHSAASGATICLSSGSYGGVSFRSLSKSSDVTVRPAPGANVTIGEVDLQTVSHLRFTGLGGSMSVDGAEVDDLNTRPNCSRHLTFDHLRFTRGVDIYPRCTNMAILIDHDNLNNLGPVGGTTRSTFRPWTRGRAQIRASRSRKAPSTVAARRASRSWAAPTACRSSTTSSHICRSPAAIPSTSAASRSTAGGTPT